MEGPKSRHESGRRIAVRTRRTLRIDHGHVVVKLKRVQPGGNKCWLDAINLKNPHASYSS